MSAVGGQSNVNRQSSSSNALPSPITNLSGKLLTPMQVSKTLFDSFIKSDQQAEAEKLPNLESQHDVALLDKNEMSHLELLHFDENSFTFQSTPKSMLHPEQEHVEDYVPIFIVDVKELKHLETKENAKPEEAPLSDSQSKFASEIKKESIGSGAAALLDKSARSVLFLTSVKTLFSAGASVATSATIGNTLKPLTDRAEIVSPIVGAASNAVSTGFGLAFDAAASKVNNISKPMVLGALRSAGTQMVQGGVQGLLLTATSETIKNAIGANKAEGWKSVGMSFGAGFLAGAITHTAMNRGKVKVADVAMAGLSFGVYSAATDAVDKIDFSKVVLIPAHYEVPQGNSSI